jgi:hypothetical protein
MLNFSPLLLLFLLPLDGSSYLADVLQSFSAAWIMLGNEVLVGIFQSPLFERIISKVRRGILQDISEVEFALLQLVQVSYERSKVKNIY